MNADTMSPLMVGRGRELDRLMGAFRATPEAGPSAVLVGGEAGVGKTRLIKEFGARAAAAGARVLTGGCLELGTDGLPFAPFTAILRQLVREIGVAGVAELLPGGATGGLGRLLPEFGAGDASSEEARARLFELVLTLFEHLADGRALVLVVEDAHWADRSTRDLLSFLIRNLGAASTLLIIVTYRTDELHRSHPLRRVLTELDRVERVQRIELSRLGRPEVAELVRTMAGSAADPELIEKVFARSEGNPLFAEALIRNPDVLSASLRDLLLAGVQRLPEETQEILRVASAGGAEIEHDLLAAVAGVSETALLQGLRPAVTANVLVVEGDGYAFRHALIREAIDDELLPGERTRLHDRYARALEADPGLMAGMPRTIALAHHWYSAHDNARALVSAWRAAAATKESLTYAESLRMASRVLELWGNVPDAAERAGVTHAEVMEAAVTVADLAGEDETGIKLATAALDEVADPMRAARLLDRRGMLLVRLGRPEGLDDLREAVRVAPAEPVSRDRAQVLTTLAVQVHGLAGTEEESRAAAEEALTILKVVGDPYAELMLNMRLAWLNLTRDDDPEAYFASLRDLRGKAERAGLYVPLMRAYIGLSNVLEEYGHSEEAVEVAREGVVKAEKYGLSRTSGTFIAMNLAEPLISLGRWDEALDVIDQALRREPPGVTMGGLDYMDGGLAVARGDLDTATERVEAARGLIGRGAIMKSQDLFPVCVLDAAIHLAQGRPDQALAAARPVLDVRGLPDETRYGLPVLVIAATACAETGDKAFLDAIEARAAELRIYGPLQEAELLTFRAEHARASGVLDRSAWEAAAAAWDALRRPYPLAKASLRCAEAAVAEDDREAAAVSLRRAAELADDLGAVPLRERIGLFARRARISVGGEPADGAPRLGLTPRETEVLRLLADGRSNREIAGALFISVKTASVHVSNILAKLGVASRGEAAAAAHRRHLFDDE